MRTIGIDGGGSKTRFVLYDEDEDVINRVDLEEASNYHLVGLERAQNVFKKGIDLVSKGEAFDAIGAGLSGVDRPKDLERIKTIFKTLGFADVVIANDGITALWGATGGTGILMISGTGSIVIGRNEKGTIVRAGGWGYAIDEVCGGYWFVNRATIAALRFNDGIGHATTLVRRLQEFFNLENIGDVIYLYYLDFDKSKVASAAKIVIEEAENGDEVSLMILKEGIEMAMKMIGIVNKKCDFEDHFTLSYTGGLFNSSYFKLRFVNAFEAYFPQGRFIEPRFDASIGAAMMAAENKRRKNEFT